MYEQKNSLSTHKTKQKIASLSSDCVLYSNLFLASQSREGNLKDFFSHENHMYPVSLPEHGKLQKCTAKLDFLDCLDELVSSHFEQPASQ